MVLCAIFLAVEPELTRMCTNMAEINSATSRENDLLIQTTKERSFKRFFVF